MKFFITGATGLVGGNIAALLYKDGHQIVASKRANSKTAHLDAFDIEWVDTDLSDTEGLTQAMMGCDGVFHCAALVQIANGVTPKMRDVNVTGTQNIIDAVEASGAGRLIHCSSVVAVGTAPDAHAEVNEETVWNLPEVGLDDGYATTKKQAEDVVLWAVAQGRIDAVIINPSYMLGPYDAKASSGRVILELAKKNLPALPSGEANVVDVRNVAWGAIQAFHKGEKGHRYILSGFNTPYADFYEKICGRLNVAPPKIKLPRLAGIAMGKGADWLRPLGVKAPFNESMMRWAGRRNFKVSYQKAAEAFGYAPTPIEPAIDDCIDWFKENGRL